MVKYFYSVKIFACSVAISLLLGGCDIHYPIIVENGFSDSIAIKVAYFGAADFIGSLEPKEMFAVVEPQHEVKSMTFVGKGAELCHLDHDQLEEILKSKPSPRKFIWVVSPSRIQPISRQGLQQASRPC
ncbi:hypothetical protein [Pigmentiphaga humi]|uniref:hypothetical protein n=1 Tax=Pigmentiphaga humi TaxID=2478468 RepID=UPI000F54BCE6|nr:hypothetical protein [Pigmentiphaga humi]